jgi:hypothetical protein
VGDARYWRAVNEVELNRDDEAWEDIELADKHLINGEVPKLAGVIAYRRKQVDVAKSKFELSLRRDRFDCETRYYLGVVLGDMRTWEDAAPTLIAAAGCFEKTESRLNTEIANIRASTQPLERQTRQIKRREDEIASNRRRIATAWYNTAVSYFSLSRMEEARSFAEKLTSDEQFSNRARELLARVP